MVPVVPVTTGIAFVVTFHMRWIFIVRSFRPGRRLTNVLRARV